MEKYKAKVKATNFYRQSLLCTCESIQGGHCKTYRDTWLTEPTESHQIGLVIGFRVRDRVYGLGLGIGSG